MQTKKDSVNERLLDAAKNEFMAKGYERASIRSIVKNAETTIGNFYNYYDSKEAIFSQLVQASYDALVYYINNHNEMSDESEIFIMDSTSVLREKIRVSLAPLLPFFDDRFLLLVDRSRGTKYENSRQELLDVLTEHFEEHMRQEALEYRPLKMGSIIASTLVEGMVNIASNAQSEAEKDELFIELILYCIIGVIGLLKGENDD